MIPAIPEKIKKAIPEFWVEKYSNNPRAKEPIAITTQVISNILMAFNSGGLGILVNFPG